MKNLLKSWIASIFKNELYPEIEKYGGLAEPLNQEFAKINSLLRVKDYPGQNREPYMQVTVEKDNKFSPVHTALEKRIFLCDFWKDGVFHASGSVTKLSDVAKVINHWLNNDISTNELVQKYPFVKAYHWADAFDENREVEYKWNMLLNRDFSTQLALREFTRLAIKDEVSSKLFPFTSLRTLCFSRCTGFPYDIEDIPAVTPLHEKQMSATTKQRYMQDLKPLFRVTKRHDEYLGEGDAAEALEIVKKNLPTGIKPARKGNTENK